MDECKPLGIGKKLDDYWEPSKKLLSDSNFVNNLREYDKVGSVPDNRSTTVPPPFQQLSQQTVLQPFRNRSATVPATVTATVLQPFGNRSATVPQPFHIRLLDPATRTTYRPR